MGQKKGSVRLGLSLWAVAILVLLTGERNHFTDVPKERTKSGNLRADGSPIPPLPPPKGTADRTEAFIAAGSRIPSVPAPNGRSEQPSARHA